MNSKDVIINILIKRDHISYNEAENLIDEFLDEMNDCETPTEIEDLFNFYFSLEPDYLDIIINEI